jgi:DNA-binding NarL/FixJ family response regulator
MTKARILIVEDEFIVAEDLSGGLEKEGYEVVDKVSHADGLFDGLPKTDSAITERFWASEPLCYQTFS